MKLKIEEILQQKRKKTRTKINTTILEREVVQSYPVYSMYESVGGYSKFYELVHEFTQTELLIPLKSKEANGRVPSLNKEYWLEAAKVKGSWSDYQLLKVSDKLKVEAYRKNPELQTDEEWERIERVYRFLISEEKRERIGKEERSYDIFGNEKFLAHTSGKQFLKRIGIELADLFIEQKGEPFQWTLLGKLEDKNDVLIVENLNLYHTLVRFYMNHKQIRKYRPNILIFGKGNSIPGSISFFYVFFPKEKVYEVSYLGDVDASGFGIYYSLKTNAPVEIKLHVPFYRMMMDYSKGTVPYKNQKNEKKVGILQEVNRIFEEAREYDLSSLVTKLWYEERRLPQETINYEILLKELAVGENDA
jgi:hypothetical protein